MSGELSTLSALCSNESRRFFPPESGMAWFVNTGDVMEGKFLHRDLSDWSTLPGQAKKAVKEGDILYSEIRPGNRRFAYVSHEEIDAVVSTKFMVLKASPNVLPRYLYHYLTSPKVEEEMKRIAESRSGTFPQITFDSVGHIEISIPDLKIQQSISSFLDSLGDKIELNRRTNETLEGIAKALFKSWFVDFDPVRAKAEGRSTGLPDEISELFPDSFEESELGEIPSGWSVASFTSQFNVLGGGTPKTSVEEFWNGDLPWFSVVDAPSDSDCWVVDTQKAITILGLENCSSDLFRNGTTIISARGTVGKVCLVGAPMAMNQSCYALQSKEKQQDIYCYYSTKEIVEILKARSHGSVFSTITRDTLKGIDVCYPNKSVINAFEELISPLMEKIKIHIEETRTLESVRDALLPRLISGELRVPDAEKMLEEVGI